MNKFDQLVKDLADGSLTFLHVQIAMRASVRDRKDLPEGIKDLLCGKGESNAGLIYRTFRLINETIGALELAYRRGEDGD
jgi:hypothetical protein